MVVAVLRRPFAGGYYVAEQGLKAVANLAVIDDNSRLLGTSGACEGE